MGNRSRSCGASPAIWDHAVSPAIQHRWIRPGSAPDIQAGWYSIFICQRNGRLSWPWFWLYNNKCAKHKFIHLLMATFKDLHIENSKNCERWYCPHHTVCVPAHALRGINSLLWSAKLWLISQGSVVTVLRWSGQNYSHLCQVLSRCCMPRIIKISQCFMELFKK